MKSVIKEGNTSEKGFPKLMIHQDGDIIVLFTSAKIGTIVYCSNGAYKIGEYLDAWIVRAFKDFNGTIELSND